MAGAAARRLDLALGADADANSAAACVGWGGVVVYVRLTGCLRTKHSIAPCGPGQVPERGGDDPQTFQAPPSCLFLEKGVERHKQVEAALPRSGSLVFPQRDNVLRLVVPSGAPRTFGHAHSQWCGGGEVLPHHQEDVSARFQALPGSVTVRVWCLVFSRVDYALGETGIQLTNALALRWPHLSPPVLPRDPDFYAGAGEQGAFLRLHAYYPYPPLRREPWGRSCEGLVRLLP